MSQGALVIFREILVLRKVQYSWQATLFRTYRQSTGLSQGAFAKLLSIGRGKGHSQRGAQSVSNIERGLSPIPKHVLPKLKDEIPTAILKNALLADYEARIEEWMK